jgi:hypothetical protein
MGNAQDKSISFLDRPKNVFSVHLAWEKNSQARTDGKRPLHL